MKVEVDQDNDDGSRPPAKSTCPSVVQRLCRELDPRLVFQTNHKVRFVVAIIAVVVVVAFVVFCWVGGWLAGGRGGGG